MANLTATAGQPGNRAAAEAVIYDIIQRVDPSGRNTKMYKDMFAALSDDQFHTWIKKLKSGHDYVSIVCDNFSDHGITVDNNLLVAKHMGLKLFQRVWTTDQTTGLLYLTNQEYLVVPLPLRRQIQTLESKISIADDNVHVDDLTSQPTGVSKTTSISSPEMLSLYAQHFQSPIIELMRVRGGDLAAMRVVDQTIHDTGHATLSLINNLGSRTKSVRTLSTFLTAMHLENNF